MFLILIFTVLFNSILFGAVIFKCSRKRKNGGPSNVSSRTDLSNNNNNNESSNRNTEQEMEKMTDEQRAKFQAEMDAAIEAEKKGKAKGNAGGGAGTGAAAPARVRPISPANTSNGLEGGTLPISLKKPISEGRSKCQVNQPVIWSIGHDEKDNNNNKKEVKSAPAATPERKKDGLKLTNLSGNVKRKAKSK